MRAKNAESQKVEELMCRKVKLILKTGTEKERNLLTLFLSDLFDVVCVRKKPLKPQ